MDKRALEELFDFFRDTRKRTPGSPVYDAALCDRLMAASSAREASIWELGTDNRLYLKYGTNVEDKEANRFSLAMGEGITGAAAMSGKTLKVDDVKRSPQHSRKVDDTIHFRTYSMISAPILFQGRLSGAINILNHSSGRDFPSLWEDLLSSVAMLYGASLGKTAPPAGQSRNMGKTGETVIIGISRCIQDVLHLSMKAGKSKVPVLIYGDTGTGKELAARKIHESMTLSQGPFLSINCAAISETLLESELFGHVKGAFSGAASRREGKFVAASGGTLFLDEIGEMSLNCQVKILRALQEKTVIPVGSDKEVSYDARIIAATNQDLKRLAGKGKFRKDLYYRLCGIEIHVPELRHRPADIPLLSEFFIQKAVADRKIDLEGKVPPALSPEAMDLLLRYPWPGNVRQLEQTIMASMVVAEGELIRPEDLPEWIRPGSLKTGSPREAEPGRDLERTKFLSALESTKYPGTGRWNIAAAARQLNIPRKTFIYRLEKLNIDPATP